MNLEANGQTATELEPDLDLAEMERCAHCAELERELLVLRCHVDAARELLTFASGLRQ